MINNFKVAYRKTKRGSIVKVRDHISPAVQLSRLQSVTEDQQATDDHKKLQEEAPSEDTRFQYPKHLTVQEVQIGLENGRLLEGKFQASKENLLEGIVAVTINNEDVHVLIQGRDCLNRAIHDDKVVIELLSESEWKSKSDLVLLPETNPENDEVIENEFIDATTRLQSINLSSNNSKNVRPTGKIVSIIKRQWRQYTGVLRRNQASLGRSSNTTRCLFVPSDRRIPVIRIETRQYETLKNQRLVVAIDSWPRASRYPMGHYVKSLGNIGDKDTENQVLLLEHDVPHLSFTDAVMGCLPPEGINWKIPPEEIKLRSDLRNLNICSVDPPGCTDIDDALHYRDLDNQFCEVGVHIADVSYFVQTGSALDKEAANRGTTVYLSDRRIDMIPDTLSSHLCSLKQNEDRLAFSTIWKMRKSTSEIVAERFVKSVIKSKASLTYDQAQAMIDDKKENGVLHKNLRGLNELAKKLRQKRLERGALVLARADEVRFVEVESETHERDANLEIRHKRLVETNSMVEEFMLLANIAVANKLLNTYPEYALLRRHPKPSRANFDDLIESAKVKGFDIIADDGKHLSESLNNAKLPNNEYFNLMLRMIATRCMTPALYFCSGYVDPNITSFTHFGLAADLYTHFTSPIRRYADLLVHRFLASAINANKIDQVLNNKHHIQLLCDQINYRHRMAQLASRASLRLHTVLYIKSKKKLVETGYVFFVRQNAIQILVPSIAYEFTYFMQPSEAWKYNPTKRYQLHIDKNIVIKQFDKLKVHVSITTKEDTRFSDKIQVKIIQPPIDEVDKQSDLSVKQDQPDVERKPTDSEMAIYEQQAIKMLDQSRDSLKYGDMRKKLRLEYAVLDKTGKPVVVLPGDRIGRYISTPPSILGCGLQRVFEETKDICSNRMGLLKSNGNAYWVDSHQKRYVAARGECVIGIVRLKASYHARVDINASDLASLSLLAFEGASKRNKPNITIGDLVYAKVLSADKNTETELVCVNSSGKREALGIIGDKGGLMIQISIDTARALLSPKCEFLERLGEKHKYEVAVGLNGRVWLNASDTQTLIHVANEVRKFDLL